MTCLLDLFDMQEVFGLKGDGLAGHGDVVVVSWCVGEVATNSERHRFVLRTRDKRLNALTPLETQI